MNYIEIKEFDAKKDFKYYKPYNNPTIIIINIANI